MPRQTSGLSKTDTCKAQFLADVKNLSYPIAPSRGALSSLKNKIARWKDVHAKEQSVSKDNLDVAEQTVLQGENLLGEIGILTDKINKLKVGG